MSLRINVLIAASVFGLTFSNLFSRSRFKSQFGFLGCILNRSSSSFRLCSSSRIACCISPAVACSTVSTSSVALSCFLAWPVAGSYERNLKSCLEPFKGRISVIKRQNVRITFRHAASNTHLAILSAGSPFAATSPDSASALRFLFETLHIRTSRQPRLICYHKLTSMQATFAFSPLLHLQATTLYQTCRKRDWQACNRCQIPISCKDVN